MHTWTQPRTGTAGDPRGVTITPQQTPHTRQCQRQRAAYPHPQLSSDECKGEIKACSNMQTSKNILPTAPPGHSQKEY